MSSSSSATAAAGINVLALGVGQSFSGKSPVSSLDFHGDGVFLLSGAEDGQSWGIEGQGWKGRGRD